MKIMTVEQVEEIRAMAVRNGRKGMPYYAAQIVRAFMEGDYDAVEVEPCDYGRTEKDMSKHTHSHMRKELGNKIVELSLESAVTALTSCGRVFLVRIDE